MAENSEKVKLRIYRLEDPSTRAKELILTDERNYSALREGWRLEIYTGKSARFDLGDAIYTMGRLVPGNMAVELTAPECSSILRGNERILRVVELESREMFKEDFEELKSNYPESRKKGLSLTDFLASSLQIPGRD